MMYNLIYFLKTRYSAKDLDYDKCKCYLNERQTLLFGLHLTDKQRNYSLMTPGDLRSLSRSTREQCIRNHSSPFDDLMLIVYREFDGTVAFKLLNGMASRVVQEMVKLCESPECFGI